jgi:hypothetical protein
MYSTWYQNHGYLDSIKAPIWLSHLKKCDLCPPEAGGRGAEVQPRYSHNQMSHEVILNIALFLLPPSLYRSLDVIIMRGATPSTPHLKGQPANFSQILVNNNKKFFTVQDDSKLLSKNVKLCGGPTGVLKTYMKTKMKFALNLSLIVAKQKCFYCTKNAFGTFDHGCYSYNIDLSSRGQTR